MKIAVLAITKNGVQIGARLAGELPDMDIYAPEKLTDGGSNTHWYKEPTSQIIGNLFEEYDALVCVFSLGAVVRLLAGHISDKKTDPAVLVIDDRLNYVISVLSGHIGGANQLACDIADQTGATAVITTAADVNQTIAVDLVGRDIGWVIEDDSNVTAVSAHMVNGERIGLYQDVGSTRWWDGPLPKNVTTYLSIDAMVRSDCRAFLVITDQANIPVEVQQRGVIYRPPSLVVGVGLHHTTTAEKIITNIKECLAGYGLSDLCIAKMASLKKPTLISGLDEASKKMNIPIEYIDRERLSEVNAPNPSDTVERFEGTASVSEAAAMTVSGGKIIIEKQKFPPDLTLAVARIP